MNFSVVVMNFLGSLVRSKDAARERKKVMKKKIKKQNTGSFINTVMYKGRLRLKVKGSNMSKSNNNFFVVF